MKKAVEQEETASISSCSTVSEDLTIRETALLNQDEPNDGELYQANEIVLLAVSLFR